MGSPKDRYNPASTVTTPGVDEVLFEKRLSEESDVFGSDIAREDDARDCPEAYDVHRHTFLDEDRWEAADRRKFIDNKPIPKDP